MLQAVRVFLVLLNSRERKRESGEIKQEKSMCDDSSNYCLVSSKIREEENTGSFSIFFQYREISDYLVIDEDFRNPFLLHFHKSA